MGAFFSTIELLNGYIFGVYELPQASLRAATLPPVVHTDHLSCNILEY